MPRTEILHFVQNDEWEAGRQARNADFILIAEGDTFLHLSVSEHNPSTQPAADRRPQPAPSGAPLLLLLRSVSVGPVNLKNFFTL